MLTEMNQESHDFDKNRFNEYLDTLRHKWLGILYIVGILTHISFAFLDYAVINNEIFINFFYYRLMVLLPLIIVFLTLYFFIWIFSGLF